MKNIDSLTFKKIINNSGIAFMGIPVKESLNYMPYGVKIRELLYSKAMEFLEENGYEKVMLSDLVNPDSLVEIDEVSKISDGYMKVRNKNILIAAGHEVNAYIYIKELLKHYYQYIDLPIKIYNFGPVFRTNKNTKYPFNLGERKSFLECYSVFKTTEEAEKELEFATYWNRNIIKNILHIPSVEVLRPISTNKKISKRTICIDSITPLNETVITGMTYFHNDIFTRALNLKYKNQTTNKNRLAYSVHFGLSENILFSYLLNSCDGENLRLYSFLAPIQVSIINTIKNSKCRDWIIKLKQKLQKNNIRFKEEKISNKKISSKIINNNMKGIPITLLLKEENGKVEVSLYQYDTNKMIDVNDDSKSINNILKEINNFLKKNDEEIRQNMEVREKESIIYCYDINKLNDIVQSGKIAKIHLKNTDENVKKLESYLNGGEILGFSLNKENGEDILSNENVDTIAYVSRRS